MKLRICRDKKGGWLTLYSEPPIWFEDWTWCKGYLSNLPREEFPKVTFENSPVEVELVIKK